MGVIIDEKYKELLAQWNSFTPIYTIPYDNATVELCNNYTCDINEIYKDYPMYIGGGSQIGLYGTTVKVITSIDIVDKDDTNDGRFAFYLHDIPGSNSKELISYPSQDHNHVVFNYNKYLLWADQELSSNINTDPSVSGSPGYPWQYRMSTNIPVFATLEEAQAYVVNHEGLTNALNYDDGSFDPFKTKYYHYYAKHDYITLNNGNVSIKTEGSYCSLNFKCSSTPTFVLNPSNFTMTLIYPTVEKSYKLSAPNYILDNVPETSWVNGLMYTGPFYCNYDRYLQAMKSEPENGDYYYGNGLNTNIPIFDSRAKAEKAMSDGDFTEAVNYAEIKGGNNYTPPDGVGDPEISTEFGGGGFLAPMMTILSGSRSDILRFADVLFTSDTTVGDAITEGLKRYGANPIDFVLGMRVFPCSVADFVTQSTRNNVYFGSYLHHFATPFNEVTNLAAKYKDAGTIRLTPIQGNYKDLEPYTSLSAYYPFAGWQTLDIKKYYNKSVNTRYYCDIMNGQAVVVTLCDGILTDIFGPFELATEIPVTGNNFALWSQGQARMLQGVADFGLQGLTGIGGVAAGGSAVGGGMSIASSGISALGGIFEMKQKGGVKNTTVTKGSYSSNINNYLPGYIIYRFDVHEMLEPDNLQTVYGRPSFSSGLVRNFSGFLKCESAQLNTAGMTENEAAEVASLLSSGIYV